MFAQIRENYTGPLTVEGKVLRGPFGAVDTFNQNERMYPRPVYEPALNLLEGKIQNRRLLGELDHPMNYDEVRLSNASHVILEASLQSNGEITGSVELLDTPSGKIAQALVEAGVPLGISSRALGATKKVNEGLEVTKIKLITYDLVADPSFSNAVLTESAKQKLMKDLDTIEESLPLKESAGDDLQGVVRLLESVRSVVTPSEDPTDDELALFESTLLEMEDTTELKESIELKDAEISHLKDLLEARDVEFGKVSDVVKSQQKIIEKLKTIPRGTSGSTAEIAELMESLGEVTLKLTESEVVVGVLETKIAELQEDYNEVSEESDRYKKLSESHSRRLAENEETLGNLEYELLQTKVKLQLESKGLPHDKYAKLFENVTTEREIEDVLKTITNLGNRQSFPSGAERIVETLSPEKGRRGLRSVVSRV